jgi:hypothetical protein
MAPVADRRGHRESRSVRGDYFFSSPKISFSMES